MSLPSKVQKQEKKEDIIKLLHQWMLAAEKMGKNERAALLSLQLVIFGAPCNWDPVVNCFKALTTTPYQRKAEKLMSQWKDFIAEKSMISHTNIAVFGPDPSEAQSFHYAEHAAWILAVEELNPPVCSQIIRRWKIDHKRRRNLWKALRQAGLSV